MCAKYRNLAFVIQYNCSWLNWITLSANSDAPFTYLATMKYTKIFFSIALF